MSQSGTHFIAESTEAMQIKCLAQGRDILMSGFEQSTSVARNRHYPLFTLLPSLCSVTSVHHHVSRLLATVVVVSVIFWHKVCVMDGEAVKIVSLQRLSKANVDYHALVELEPWNLE